MRRLIYLLTMTLLMSGSLFAEHPKFDSALIKKIQELREGRADGSDRVRVIIQRDRPASLAELLDMFRDGGLSLLELRSLRATVAELPLSKIESFGENPGILKVWLDEPVYSHATDFRTVSGASVAAKKYGATGAGIGVAVIDSGIAYHQDLNNVVKAVDFVRNRNWGGIDAFGHGTHVASIIGGSGRASDGVYKGMAPGVKLIDLRVLDQNGKGYTSDVIAAIEWAIEHKNDHVNGVNLNIRVINLSLGHLPTERTSTDPLTTACRLAVRNGIVVVAAAGNYGKSSAGETVYGSISSPANEPAVITVGAMSTFDTDTRLDDKVATYSSRGPTAVENILKPDIAAPGSRLIGATVQYSSIATQFPGLRVGSYYTTLSGTSMAAAVVTGAVAMMLEENPSLTPNAVKAALMFTAEDRNETALEIGSGYLNVAGAVNLASNIDVSATTGQYWIRNNGLSLNYSNLIAGASATWGQTIVWGDALFAGNIALYNQEAWGQTIVWGEDLAWATTIVWETDALSLRQLLTPLTIVWEDALTIVWEEALTIVWEQE